jgi:hypothetical protein
MRSTADRTIIQSQSFDVCRHPGKVPQAEIAFLEWCRLGSLLDERMDEEWERGDVEAPLCSKSPAISLTAIGFATEPEEDASYVIERIGEDRIVLPLIIPHWDAMFPMSYRRSVAATTSRRAPRKILGKMPQRSGWNDGNLTDSVRTVRKTSHGQTRTNRLLFHRRLNESKITFEGSRWL